MPDVYLSVYGDGSATTDATPPMTEGEIFTIFFHPDGGSELLDVRAFDSHDYAVALPPVTDNELTMRFRSGWGSLYVDIYFTGAEPPEPSFPFWILFFRKKKHRKKIMGLF